MSKQYYVVSEEELQTLAMAALNYWEMQHLGREDNSEEDDYELYDKANAACRARPVPEWAEEFAGLIDPASEYGPDVHYSIHRLIQRIKK